MFRELIQSIRQLLTWWITVAPWEQALRVRGGKRVTLLFPGVRLRIPVFDRIYRQPIRMRMTPSPAQTLTTKDMKTITLSGMLGYEIRNLETLYRTLHDPHDTIVGQVCGLIADFVADNNLANCKPLDIEIYVASNLHLEKYGLQSSTFNILNYCVVKTYRIIDQGFRDWGSGQHLNTTEESIPVPTAMPSA